MKQHILEYLGAFFTPAMQELFGVYNIVTHNITKPDATILIRFVNQTELRVQASQLSLDTVSITIDDITQKFTSASDAAHFIVINANKKAPSF